ncbi:hypothetical protein BDZ97DRAFT_1766372 [Flammula alnicola]|nr:hypothetical protein BDZ97DRAFT_1766372 [Flammula alnicola]
MEEGGGGTLFVDKAYADDDDEELVVHSGPGPAWAPEAVNANIAARAWIGECLLDDDTKKSQRYRTSWALYASQSLGSGGKDERANWRIFFASGHTLLIYHDTA